MPSTQQRLRRFYRAARGFAATARLPDRATAHRHRKALRAELSGNWSAASALWFEQRASLIEANMHHANVDKNLSHCALAGAREAEQAKAWAAALQSWEYARAVDPGSEPAAKGIERCARQLAVELDGAGHDELALRYPLHRLPQAWKIDVLLRMGKGHAASDCLMTLESTVGHTATSCKQRAQIALYSGNFREASDAARESIALMKGHRQSSECALLWAEALIAQNQPAQARDMLFANLPAHGALNDRDFEALFATARSRDDIDRIRDFLEPSFAPGHRSRASALKQYGIALRDLGFATEAHEIARQRLLEALRKPFGDSPRAANAAWSRGAERALCDLKSDLDAGGFTFFLISGTLLGAVREGRVLAHDKDLDVGVFTEVNIPAMRTHLQKTGRFVVKPLPAQTIVRVIHANGTSIDIFLHWLEEGRMVHQGQKAKWLNSPFTLKPMDFLGTTFQVPGNPELYLEENYGDWKTPAKDFDTAVDTPNMTVTDRDHIIWYYYTGLQNYHAWGSANRFAKLWTALSATAPVDAELASKIEEQLAARHGGSAGP